MGAEVTFELADGTGLATTDELVVESRFTNADGIATFGPEEGSDNPLSIGDANQPFTTDYKLIPVATPPGEEAPSVEGDASDGVRHLGGRMPRGRLQRERPERLNETYTAGEDVGMGASVVPVGSSEISCAEQRLIFANSIFFHATTGDGTDTVFLVTHITRADMKAATNNGQRHIGWCIGLKSSAPWIRNGASFTTQVVERADALTSRWRRSARTSRRAAEFAPCIVSQIERQHRRKHHPWLRASVGTRPAAPDPRADDQRKRAPGPDRGRAHSFPVSTRLVPSD